MIKKIMSLVFVMCCSVHADFKGLEEAKAVFNNEITVILDLYKALEEKSDFTPILDSSLSTFIRNNSKQIADELCILLDVTKKVRSQPEVQQKVRAFNAALKTFIFDEGLANAQSGTDIIALASYQNMKIAQKECEVSLRIDALLTQEQIPLLHPIFAAIEKYGRDLLFDRLEQALVVISWDAPLSAILGDWRTKDQRVDEFFNGAEISISTALSDESAEAVWVDIEPVKTLLRAFFTCYASDFVIEKLRLLKITKNSEVAQSNSDILMSLYFDKNVQVFIRACEDVAKMKTSTFDADDSDCNWDCDASCELECEDCADLEDESL